MHVGMDGNKVKRIIFPLDYQGQKQSIEYNREDGNDVELFLRASRHGEFDTFWIVHCLNGVEIARYNCKYLITIEWLND